MGLAQMHDQRYPQLDWPLTRLAEEATRAFIEREGVTSFDQYYARLESQIQRYSDDLCQQRVYAAIHFIDATRRDSPKRNTVRAALTLIWLARHHQAAAARPIQHLVEEMLPAYAEEYGGKAARSRAYRHRGYLVYQAEGTGSRVSITSVLLHPDERTETLVHGREDSRCIFCEERETVDLYVFPVWPGERIQFTVRRGQERAEAWYTITPFGPQEEPSRSTIWLAILHQSDIATGHDEAEGRGAG